MGVADFAVGEQAGACVGEELAFAKAAWAGFVSSHVKIPMWVAEFAVGEQAGACVGYELAFAEATWASLRECYRPTPLLVPQFDCLASTPQLRVVLSALVSRSQISGIRAQIVFRCPSHIRASSSYLTARG